MLLFLRVCVCESGVWYLFERVFVAGWWGQKFCPPCISFSVYKYNTGRAQRTDTDHTVCQSWSASSLPHLCLFASQCVCVSPLWAGYFWVVFRVLDAGRAPPVVYTASLARHRVTAVPAVTVLSSPCRPALSTMCECGWWCFVGCLSAPRAHRVTFRIQSHQLCALARFVRLCGVLLRKHTSKTPSDDVWYAQHITHTERISSRYTFLNRLRRHRCTDTHAHSFLLYWAVCVCVTNELLCLCMLLAVAEVDIRWCTHKQTQLNNFPRGYVFDRQSPLRNQTFWLKHRFARKILTVWLAGSLHEYSICDLRLFKDAVECNKSNDVWVNFKCPSND